MLNFCIFITGKAAANILEVNNNNLSIICKVRSKLLENALK